MKKALIIILVLLLVLAGGVWYFVSFRLDGMIEQRIEQSASLALGSRVTVGGVRTSVRDGSLTISDITVANPPGFRNPNAFSLKNIEAAVDYASFEVKRVVIDRPDIVIEEKGGDTNFSRMLAELEKVQSEGGTAATGPEEPEIVVRHFRMNQSRAAFESESLDRYSDLEVDAVELNDIRGTPTEVAEVIARAVLQEVVSEAGKELLKAQGRKYLDDAEQKVSDKLKDLMGGDDSG